MKAYEGNKEFRFLLLKVYLLKLPHSVSFQLKDFCYRFLYFIGFYSGTSGRILYMLYMCTH